MISVLFLYPMQSEAKTETKPKLRQSCLKLFHFTCEHSLTHRSKRVCIN